jgi:serine O-acetyltransferase
MLTADRPGASRLEAAVEGLLESYARVGGINQTEGKNLPSLSGVVSALHLLEGVLFPGYYEQSPLGRRNLRYVIGARGAGLLVCLREEIARSVAVGARGAGGGEPGGEASGAAPGPGGARGDLRRAADGEAAGSAADSAVGDSARGASGAEVADSGARARAERIVAELLEALPSIREMLHEDARAALEGDPAARSIVEVVLAYPSIRALGVQRVAQFLQRRRVPLIPRMMSEHVHGQTGIDIHPGAAIGPGLFIDHGTGVVIGETAVLGRWCKLYQGVTLGALSVVKEGEASWEPAKRHPTLEDRVTVYAGATILGGETVIGEGSVIGGNVWLTRSVPAGTTVQIEPPLLRYRGASSASPVVEALDYQI